MTTYGPINKMALSYGDEFWDQNSDRRFDLLWKDFRNKELNFVLQYISMYAHAAKAVISPLVNKSINA